MAAHTNILRIALPIPLRRLFDYLPPQDIDCKSLLMGIRVRVPFQSRTLVGILIEVVNETSVPYGKLKTILECLDEHPILPADIYKLCTWAADYYHYPLGEVLSSALPVLLRKGRGICSIDLKINKCLHAVPPTLNAAQQEAVSTMLALKEDFHVFLLDGVTGSGKTEVYIRTMEEIIRVGKQILVLVPEISLTPQTIERFRARFHVPIAMMHSHLGEKARLQAWIAAKTGSAKIVIGTRSAIFTPFAALGLIVVDEEHDTSFKQHDGFRYHARDLAIIRAQTNRIPIVLGSATPSLESLLNVKRQRYYYLSLPTRAGKASMPDYEIIDLRHSALEEGLSTSLLQMMRSHLDQDNQVMLFLNRRGFAPVLYCTQCRGIVKCQRCDARMVYHRKPLHLQCHHCNTQRSIPIRCEQCQQVSLHPIGVGTQRLEKSVEQYFSDVPIIRIDRDSTRRKGAIKNLLDQVHNEKKAILLGTQMLAKGHHFPNVTLVGIIDADGGLFSADFRASEQMGQLLIQVSGRAGRAEKIGTVAIQTRHPEHSLLQTLIQQGYQPFAHALMIEREQAMLPPFSYFALFRAESYTEKMATDFLEAIKKINVSLTDTVTVLGPISALISKRRGLHCQQLLIRSNERRALQHFLKDILMHVEKLSTHYSVKWNLDVDPLEVT
jgi:primosomal protein N' (replication factor Y)